MIAEYIALPPLRSVKIDNNKHLVQYIEQNYNVYFEINLKDILKNEGKNSVET
jgi:hypothetical protein